MTALEEAFLAFQSPGTKEKVAIEDPITVPSAAGLMPAPRAYLSTVSGGLAINLIALPWVGFAGTVCFIPAAGAAFTFATGGVATDVNKPIGAAVAAVTPGVPVFLTYSQKAGFWYVK